jgi:hypothetical protein
MANINILCPALPKSGPGNEIRYSNDLIYRIQYCYFAVLVKSRRAAIGNRRELGRMVSDGNDSSRSSIGGGPVYEGGQG